MPPKETTQASRARALSEAGVGFWNLSYADMRLSWSPEVYAILGMPESADADFAALERLIDPSQRERFRETLAKIALGTPAEKRAYRVKRPDGSALQILFTAAIEPDSSAAAGLIQDITAEPEDQPPPLAPLVDSIPEALVYTDENRCVRLANPAFERLFGYGAQELHGTPTRLLYANPEDFDQQGRQRFNPAAQPDFAPYEIHYRRKDGSTFLGETLGGAARDPSGRLLGYIGIIRDIEQKRRREDHLALQTRMLKRAEETASIGHWSFDIPTLTLHWSDEVYRIHGLDPNSYTPTVETAVSAYHPNDRQTIADAVQTAMETGSDFDLELRIIRPDGRIRNIHTRGECEFGPDGKLELVFGVFQDITSRKRTESELLLAKERAEESDRLKSAFLANISHEIRTPLNAILGFSQILKTVDLDRPESNRYIDIIDTSGKHLLQLVGDIIDLAQIESGQMDLQAAPFDLNQMMMDAQSLFLSEIQRHEISDLRLVLETQMLKRKRVIGDETRIRQVLYNLLSNAVKYTPAGAIRFGYAERDGGQIEFYVKDTGIGIDPKLHHAVFERFQQADNELTRTHEGVGLGLSICRGLIQLLGGSIWLESEPNQGSTFHFQIPLPCSAPAPFQPEAPPLPPLGVRYTILIAEDEAMNYLVLERMLAPRDLQILWAKDGAQAIQACRENSMIDLVLMDLKMPNTDGLEATRLIKSIRPDLPIIAQTAYALVEDRARSTEAGCDAYIAKPINAAELLDLVDRYLCNSAQ